MQEHATDPKIAFDEMAAQSVFEFPHRILSMCRAIRLDTMRKEAEKAKAK